MLTVSCDVGWGCDLNTKNYLPILGHLASSWLGSEVLNLSSLRQSQVESESSFSSLALEIDPLLLCSIHLMSQYIQSIFKGKGIRGHLLKGGISKILWTHVLQHCTYLLVSI